jgi:hypothetical protein
VEIRRVQIQPEADEHAAVRVAFFRFVGSPATIVERGRRHLEREELLRQQFLQFLRRDAEAIERHAQLVDRATDDGAVERPFLEFPRRFRFATMDREADDRDRGGLVLRRFLAQFLQARLHPADLREQRAAGAARVDRPDGTRSVGLALPFLEQQVGVHPAEAEAADGGLAGAPAPVPVLRLGEDAERTGAEVQLVGGFGEVRLRGPLRRGHREYDLHRRGGAGAREQVADGRLHGADRALPRRPARFGPPQFVQALELHRVADRRAGRVAFDQVDVGRPPAGLAVGGAHGAELPLDGGREQIPHAVVGKPRAGEHGEDRIAAGDGVREPLQHEDARAFAHHEAVGGAVERRTAAARRQGAQLREAHLRVLAVGAGTAAGEHRVGAAGEQFVRRQLERVQGRRAGGVERVAAETQAERFRQQPGGQPGRVAVPAMDAPAAAQAEVRAEEFARKIVRLVRRQADVPKHHADLAPVHVRDVRAAPGAMADVEHQMEERVEFAQEVGGQVEAGDVGGERVEEIAARGIDRVGVGDARVGAAVGGQVPATGGDVARAVVRAGDVRPELFEVRPAAGKPTGHADDGDAIRGGHGRCILPAGKSTNLRKWCEMESGRTGRGTGIDG